MGAYQYAEGIFPLGGRRGEQTAVTFFGARLGAGVQATADLRSAGPPTPSRESDYPIRPRCRSFRHRRPARIARARRRRRALPVVINGRLDKDGEIDRYRFQVEPGEKLLLELQARELGTSKLEGIITAYDADGKKLGSAGDQPLPEDVFAVQGTSRTSSDPFLNLTVPDGLHEIDRQRRRPRPARRSALRLPADRARTGRRLQTDHRHRRRSTFPPAARSCSASRRTGAASTVRSSSPFLTCRRASTRKAASSRASTWTRATRAPSTAAASCCSPPTPASISTPRELQVWGEGKLADGTVLRRRARGSAWSWTSRAQPNRASSTGSVRVTAPWLGLDLPVAMAEAPAATLEVRQTNVKPMEEGVRYEYAYKWTLRGSVTPPPQVGVDVIGAKDLRIIDMKPRQAQRWPARSPSPPPRPPIPARYDLYISGRLRTDDGDEVIVSRPIPFEVTGGNPSAK